MQKTDALQQQFSLFDEEEPSTNEDITKPPRSNRYSNYVVYVDESGDHGMQTLDVKYPMFVLAFCVFHKRHYSEKVAPALQKFKFNHFGHDLIILHENEIRKEKGAFNFFQTRLHKHAFLNELTGIIDASNFILISCVIDKEQLRSNKSNAIPNPYHIALGFCLETLYEFLQEKNQNGTITHIVVECRGKKEDNELELEFHRMCAGSNKQGIQLPFNIIFADKKVNSAGLQLADLVARPVGMSVLRPEQENRAFDALKRKFYCSGGREKVGEGFENWGLKVYPSPISEKPR